MSRLTIIFIIFLILRLANSQQDLLKFSGIVDNPEVSKNMSHIFKERLMGELELLQDSLKEETDETTTKKWTDWSEWTSCSASCGDGKAMSWRLCSGSNCALGEKEVIIKKCHLQPCL